MKRRITILTIVVACMFSAICFAEEEHEMLQSGDYEYYINDDGMPINALMTINEAEP